MSVIEISKNDEKVGEIQVGDSFPHKWEIDRILEKFGPGEYELTAPNGRKWKRVQKDLVSYLMDV